MSIEHQPHATATFFELAIALSVLAWRTYRSIQFIPDPPQTETERIIQSLGRKEGLTIINHNNVLKWCGKWAIISSAFCSIGGLIFFGTGWYGIKSEIMFWFSFMCFLISSIAAVKAETVKIIKYNKTEKEAAKKLEKFSNEE
jgi:hypothetical protein